MSRRIGEERMCNEHAHKEMNVPPFVGGIDPQLEQAGWYLRDHSRVKIEITACPDALLGVDGYDAVPWNGVTDYCHLRS